MKTALLTLTLLLLFITSYAHADSYKSPKRHDLHCLALNIYHEARGESVKGQLAIAIVTLNRVKSIHYPNSICKVVWQSRQFSWTRNPQPVRDLDAWTFAVAVAVSAIKGTDLPLLKKATHYHADYIRPGWSKRLKRVKKIGSHIFYKSTP